MKITEKVMIVGSGVLGFGISHERDCNVYLLHGGQGEYALIDAGSGEAPESIVKNIESKGISMNKIKYCLLTHIHGDHAAGANYFSSKYGMKVICSLEAKEWLENGDEEKASIKLAKEGGVYPKDFKFPPCTVTRGVQEGDTIQIGDITVEVINTPGHSRGHVSYIFEENGNKCLFAGDTVFSRGRVVIQYIWDCFIQDYVETVDKLNSLKVDSLYPGHGPFILNNASNHIELAKNYFDRLEIPPNL